MIVRTVFIRVMVAYFLDEWIFTLSIFVICHRCLIMIFVILLSQTTFAWSIALSVNYVQLFRLNYYIWFYFYFVDCEEVNFYVFGSHLRLWVKRLTHFPSFYILFIISLISLMYCHDGSVSVPSDYFSLIPFNSV